MLEQLIINFGVNMDKVEVRPGVFIYRDISYSLNEPKIIKLLVDFKSEMDKELSNLNDLNNEYMKKIKNITTLLNGTIPIEKELSPEVQEDLVSFKMEFVTENPILEELLDIDVYSVPTFMKIKHLNLKQAFLLTWIHFGIYSSFSSILTKLNDLVVSIHPTTDILIDSYKLENLIINIDSYNCPVKKQFILQDIINYYNIFVNQLNSTDKYGFDAGILYLYKKLINMPEIPMVLDTGVSIATETKTQQ